MFDFYAECQKDRKRSRAFGKMVLLSPTMSRIQVKKLTTSENRL